MQKELELKNKHVKIKMNTCKNTQIEMEGDETIVWFRDTVKNGLPHHDKKW